MENAIKEAKNIIENNYYLSGNYTSMFAFTTENIKGIMESIDVKNKNILTVSSSGDHIFNMLLHGATNIESYDVNYFTKYYFYFKESAIKTLTYKEFLDFFFENKFKLNNKVYNKKAFELILSNIKNKEAKIFWETLYNKYDIRTIFYSDLFIPNYYTKSTYIECNDYLNNEANYKILQNKLNNFNYKFVWLNIFNDLSNINNKKYDIIYLSNILDKLHCKNELTYVKKVKAIITELKKHLTENGLLGVCYLYYYLDEYWDLVTYKKLNSPELRYKYFKDEFTYKNFNGINTINSNIPKNRDALMLTLKK